MAREIAGFLRGIERLAIFFGIGRVKKLIASVALATALVAGPVFMAVPANASTIDWTLSGVTFDDGGTATGTFTTVSGLITSFDITTTPGTVVSGFEYSNATASSNLSFVSTTAFELDSSSFGAVFLQFVFVSSLDVPGTDPLLVHPAFSFESCQPGFNCVDSFDLGSGRNILSGEAVSATPLPSTWLMLLSGFVGLSFFAYRGAKKNTALAAA